MDPQIYINQKITCPHCFHCFSINKSKINKRKYDESSDTIYKKQKVKHIIPLAKRLYKKQKVKHIIPLAKRLSKSLDNIIKITMPQYDVMNISDMMNTSDICYFDYMPLEIVILILSLLDEEDLYITQDVCVIWHNLSNYILWKDIADLAYPNMQWLCMQSWQQRKMLDQEIDDYYYEVDDIQNTMGKMKI